MCCVCCYVLFKVLCRVFSAPRTNSDMYIETDMGTLQINLFSHSAKLRKVDIFSFLLANCVQSTAKLVFKI